ncbi:hypothetical protein LXL04_017968 [Taraxacum kok-saghyz]
MGFIIIIITMIGVYNAFVYTAYLFQSDGEKTDETPEAPASPISTNDYNVIPDQIVSAIRYNDYSTLLKFGTGCKRTERSADMGYPRDAPATVLFGEWFRFVKPSDQQFLFEKTKHTSNFLAFEASLMSIRDNKSNKDWQNSATSSKQPSPPTEDHLQQHQPQPPSTAHLPISNRIRNQRMKHQTPTATTSLP